MKWISSARVSRSTGGLRVVAALAFLAAAGCHSLEVTNPDNPDVTRALSSGTDIQSLLAGGFKDWHYSLTSYNANMAWDVAADHYESAWGNWGMRYTGWEPRIYKYSNTHTDPGTWTPIGEEIWYNDYAAVVAANLVLKALASGVGVPSNTDSSSNPMIRAAAKFLQGASMATVADAYDSGYALDEATDVTKIKLVGRDSVLRMALSKLDQAITLSAGGTWSIPEAFLGQTGAPWTASQLNRAANTWAARSMAYFPHNPAENTAVNWGKVLTYAQNGISSGTPFDMLVIGDGGNNWYDLRISVGEDFEVWERTNYRVTCLLDPTYHCHKANNGIFDRMPVSADYRFNGDDVPGDNCIGQNVIAYTAIVAGKYCTSATGMGGADFLFDSTIADWPGYASSRGYWRWSDVAHIRYFDLSWAAPTTFLGPSPFVIHAENDLLWAEALVRTSGSFATAAAKINNSRVTRGHLPALTGSETLAQMLSAIIYERAIELYSTGDRVAYYDARRWAPDITPHYYTGANDSVQTGWTPYGTGLQPGTPRLFPVPAQELGLLGDTIYSYGGMLCGADLNACTHNLPEPPAPPAHGAPVHGTGSIFGVSPDGRVILGPGKYNRIAEAMQAETRRTIRSLKRM